MQSIICWTVCFTLTMVRQYRRVLSFTFVCTFCGLARWIYDSLWFFCDFLYDRSVNLRKLERIRVSSGFINWIVCFTDSYCYMWFTDHRFSWDFGRVENRYSLYIFEESIFGRKKLLRYEDVVQATVFAKFLVWWNCEIAELIKIEFNCQLLSFVILCDSA